jgi:hypothetical protein
MFYANPSSKKAVSAYRGVWSAFGEDFDFPVSHNWVSISGRLGLQHRGRWQRVVGACPQFEWFRKLRKLLCCKVSLWLRKCNSIF